jgi:iduronate 2-sulfatase
MRKGKPYKRHEANNRPITEGSEDIPDNHYDDGAIAEAGVEMLKKLAAADKPFFLAVGFKKPHLPFVAPKKILGTFISVRILGSPNTRRCRRARRSLPSSPDGNCAVATPPPKEGPIPEDMQLEMIHGYHACVSYIDAQVGKTDAGPGGIRGGGQHHRRSLG